MNVTVTVRVSLLQRWGIYKSPVTWQDAAAAAAAAADDDDDDDDGDGDGGGDYLDWVSSMKRDGETDKKLT